MQAFFLIPSCVAESRAESCFYAGCETGAHMLEHLGYSETSQKVRVCLGIARWPGLACVWEEVARNPNKRVSPFSTSTGQMPLNQGPTSRLPWTRCGALLLWGRGKVLQDEGDLALGHIARALPCPCLWEDRGRDSGALPARRQLTQPSLSLS